MKNMPDTFSIHFACLQTSACFNIEKTVKCAQIKARHFWHRSSFCIFCSVIALHLAETVFLTQNSPDIWNNIPLAGYLSLIPKILRLLCEFVQNVPWKFAIAWGFQNNTCKESSDNWCFKQPNGFMSSVPHEMSIKSFLSFVFGPKWWGSKITQKLKLGKQVLWKPVWKGL